MSASNQPLDPIPEAEQSIQGTLRRLDHIEKIVQKQRQECFTALSRRIKRRKALTYIAEKRDKLVRGFKRPIGLIFFAGLCVLVGTIIATMNARLEK